MLLLRGTEEIRNLTSGKVPLRLGHHRLEGPILAKALDIWRALFSSPTCDLHWLYFNLTGLAQDTKQSGSILQILDAT